METVITALAIALGCLAFWSVGIALAGALWWRPLADRFPAGPWPDPETGVQMRWQAVRIGRARYGGAMDAVLADEGLYLRMGALFFVGHPPIMIPWTAMGAPQPVRFGGVEIPIEGDSRLLLDGKLAGLVPDALLLARTVGDLPVDDLPVDDLPVAPDARTVVHRTGSGRA